MGDDNPRLSGLMMDKIKSKRVQGDKNKKE